MTHCTVCGAAAREGAKFCTSCGARLVDTVVPVAEPADAQATVVAEPAAAGTPDMPEDRQQVAESTWGPVENGAVVVETEVAPSEEPEPDAAESAEYTASWPTDEGGTGEPVSAAPAGADDGPGATWSSWSVTKDDPGTGPAPASFATDADQDPRPDASRSGELADGGADSREATVVEPAPADPMDESHQGASQWESWTPEASGAATVPATGGDVGASVRRLLDDLADRIDRLIDPAPVTSRGVDADELADQLDRWSNASTDADGLLDVVRAVRTSPRDVDALTRLADRAPDLELLVRHYQAITGSAGEWASKLRDQAPRDEA